jgi:hypothetical protein
MMIESWLNPSFAPRPLHGDSKTTDNFPDFLSLGEEPKEVGLIKIANIEGDIEL